jgi:hypothetical protein
MCLARWWGRGDDGGGKSAVVDLSLESVRLELTVWEQWV